MYNRTRTIIVRRSVDGIIINTCSVRRTNIRHIDGLNRHYDNEETEFLKFKIVIILKK